MPEAKRWPKYVYMMTEQRHYLRSTPSFRTIAVRFLRFNLRWPLNDNITQARPRVLYHESAE